MNQIDLIWFTGAWVAYGCAMCEALKANPVIRELDDGLTQSQLYSLKIVNIRASSRRPYWSIGLMM